MKPINGNVLVLVDSTVVEKIGLIFQDIRFNKHSKTVITGLVVAAPEFGDHNPLNEINEGMPRRLNPRAEYVYCDEFKCEIQAGDKVYFHYLSLEQDQNFVQHADGKKIYRVDVSEIFCYVREGVIHPNLNWVLGVPFWAEAKDLGNGVKGYTKIIDVAGEQKEIVSGIQFKPEVNIATIKHIGLGVFEPRKNIKAEDICYLTPDCEFENEIEGVKYWCFKHEDIIAVKSGNLVAPCRDWCLIWTDPKVYEGALHVNHDYLMIPFSGKVFTVGDEPVIPLKKGDNVIFSQRDMRMVSHNIALLTSKNIICHESIETT